MSKSIVEKMNESISASTSEYIQNTINTIFAIVNDPNEGPIKEVKSFCKVYNLSFENVAGVAIFRDKATGEAIPEISTILLYLSENTPIKELPEYIQKVKHLYSESFATWYNEILELFETSIEIDLLDLVPSYTDIKVMHFINDVK